MSTEAGHLNPINQPPARMDAGDGAACSEVGAVAADMLASVKGFVEKVNLKHAAPARGPRQFGGIDEGETAHQTLVFILRELRAHTNSAIRSCDALDAPTNLPSGVAPRSAPLSL